MSVEKSTIVTVQKLMGVPSYKSPVVQEIRITLASVHCRTWKNCVVVVVVVAIVVIQEGVGKTATRLDPI